MNATQRMHGWWMDKRTFLRWVLIHQLTILAQVFALINYILMTCDSSYLHEPTIYMHLFPISHFFIKPSYIQDLSCRK